MSIDVFFLLDDVDLILALLFLLDPLLDFLLIDFLVVDFLEVDFLEVDFLDVWDFLPAIFKFQAQNSLRKEIGFR